MNKYPQYVLQLFNTPANAAYLRKVLMRAFDNNPQVDAYLAVNLPNMLIAWTRQVDKAIAYSDPVPGVPPQQELADMNRQFLSDKITFIRDFIVGREEPCFVIGDGAPTARLNPVGKSAAGLLREWNMNSARQTQLREDPQAQSATRETTSGYSVPVVYERNRCLSEPRAKPDIVKPLGAQNCHPLPRTPQEKLTAQAGTGAFGGGVVFCDQSQLGLQNHILQYENNFYRTALNASYMRPGALNYYYGGNNSTTNTNNYLGCGVSPLETARAESAIAAANAEAAFTIDRNGDIVSGAGAKKEAFVASVDWNTTHADNFNGLPPMTFTDNTTYKYAAPLQNWQPAYSTGFLDRPAPPANIANDNVHWPRDAYSVGGASGASTQPDDAYLNTVFGVSTPAANKRLLSRRVFRSEGGVENAIPYRQIKNSHRYFDRDPSETLRGTEFGCMVSGYDMSGLLAKLDYRAGNKASAGLNPYQRHSDAVIKATY